MKCIVNVCHIGSILRRCGCKQDIDPMSVSSNLLCPFVQAHVITVWAASCTLVARSDHRKYLQLYAYRAFVGPLARWALFQFQYLLAIHGCCGDDHRHSDPLPAHQDGYGPAVVQKK